MARRPEDDQKGWREMSVFAEPIMTDPRGRRFARLRADELDELHEFVRDAALGDPLFVARGAGGQLPHYELTPRQRKLALRAGATALEWRAALHRVREAAVAEMRNETVALLANPRLLGSAPLGSTLLETMPADTAALVWQPARPRHLPGGSRRNISAFTLSKTGLRGIHLTPRRPAADHAEPCEVIALVPLAS